MIKYLTEEKAIKLLKNSCFVISIAVLLIYLIFVQLKTPVYAQGIDFGVDIDTATGVITGYAWNENLGWIDFNGVTYDSASGELQGVADIVEITNIGQDGAIHMQGQCLPACGPYGVTMDVNGSIAGLAWNEEIGWVEFKTLYSRVWNDSAKTPSVQGWAWNENIGWIQMRSQAVPPSGDFGVHIDELTGTVSNYAWSEGIGWIDFNGVSYDVGSGALTGIADITGISGQGGDGALYMSGDCTPSCGGYAVTVDSVGKFHGHAWNDLIGWVEFKPPNFGGVWHNVEEVPSVSGWAWNDNIGWIEMGAGTFPPPDNECLASPFNTCKWAWNDNIGWISHNSIDDPGTPVFGVHADANFNRLTGYAWNDILGYIEFNSALYDTASGDLYGAANIPAFDPNGSLALSGDCIPSCGGFGVTINGDGTVTGYAWNDIIGWVDFAPALGGVFHNPDREPNLSGWAWNDLYGWISFNFTEYELEWGVNLDPDAQFSGFAWSDNVGWIDYAPAGPFPSTPNYSAKWDQETGEISGWIHILSQGSSGYILMRDDTPTAYGVTLDPDTGAWSGYAWNEDLGWIQYDHAYGNVITNLDITFVPAVPVLVSPISETGCAEVTALSPVMQWSPFSGEAGSTQAQYQIQIDDDPDFSSLIVDETIASPNNVYTVGLGVMQYNVTYYWQVRVQDSGDLWSEWGTQGALGESNCLITPKHALPECAFSIAPLNPLVDQPAQFTDETIVYDPPGLPGTTTIVEWDWDFGDGNILTGGDPLLHQNPEHTYSTTGGISTSLHVTDSDGYECTVDVEAEVKQSLPEYKRIIPR